MLGRLWIICWTLGLMLASADGQFSYNVTDLGTLGGSSSAANSINSNDQVAGTSYTTDDAAQNAFISGTGGALPLRDLGTLGGLQSFGQSLNSSGVVVGSSQLSGSSFMHAFISGPNGGALSDLQTLGGSNSYAFGINGSGQVAGHSLLAGNSVSHAYLSAANGGSLQDLGTLPGGTSSFLFGTNNAVNASGQVTGYSNTSSGNNHAFLSASNGGALSDLGTLGGSNSFGISLNNSGQVVGRSDLPTVGQMHAFRSAPNGGPLLDLGTLGGSSSVAEGINSTGTVVGYSYLNGNGTQHGFIYTTAYGIKDLNVLLVAGSGIEVTDAHAINDQGHIVGTGLVNGYGHAVLLVPILPTIQITSISRLSNGHIEIDGHAGSSQAYGLEATPDLSQAFVRVATVIATGTGVLQYEDTDAPTFSRRFYRFVYP